MTFTLLYRKGTCALAPYLALAEANAEFEVVDVSDRPDFLLSFNPRGKVPTLRSSMGVLTENVAILTHIAQTYPHAELLPENDWVRSQCLSTLAWFASTLHIDYRRFVKPYVFATEDRAQAEVKELGRTHFIRDLSELNSLLQGRSSVIADKMTIADLYGLVFVEWALTSELYDNSWNNLTNWYRGITSRPKIRSVLEQVGSPLLRNN